MTENRLNISAFLQVKPHNGGCFISHGRGTHPKRIIDSFELIFVTSGKLFIREEKRNFIVGEGETLLLWPGRLHAGTERFEKKLRFFWIHFEILGSGKLPGKMESMHLVDIPQHNRIARPYRLMELFRSFLDEQEKSTLTPVMSSLYLTMMLAEASMTAASEGAGAVESGMAGTHATRVEQFIKENYQKNISTSSIARHLKCNPDYVGRMFRKVFGKTITDAIIEQKLKTAIHLLLESDANVNEVAAESGFTDTGYFRKKFKQYKGVSPARYRKLYSRMHLNTA